MVVIVVSSSVLFSLIIPTSDFLSLDRGWWGGNGGGVEGPKWDDILGLIEGERGKMESGCRFWIFSLSFFLSFSFPYLFPCVPLSLDPYLFFSLNPSFTKSFSLLTPICPFFLLPYMYNHYTYSQNFSSINIIPTTLEYNGDWKSYYFYVLKRHKILGFP